jgi:undecaprenyl pyrophosphate phosphatase UppP
MDKKKFRYEKLYFWLMIGTIVLIALGMATSATFLQIISKPDNVPIAIMLVVVEFFTWLAFKQAARNDDYTREGQRQKIYEDMIR